nr:beta-1,6-N-acetylglucosaminyltransferase [uncultured Eisenbergiella sp.]
MRHAYLIVVHSGWEQLKMLLECLDSENTDIYIHIDKKAKNVPVTDIKNAVKNSCVEIYREYKVYWGSFELVQVELFLFKKASEKHYDYYHLISGTDFPIKTKSYIDDFFEKNSGCEFVHFDTDERLRNDKELGRRTRLYHFLQNYRRRFSVTALNTFFTFLERCLLVTQLVLHVDRMKKNPDFKIRYGSQWVSITDELVRYIISQESSICEIFKWTNCADELFIQSLVYNSEFKKRLYDGKFNDDIHANIRLIDMKKRGKNGNPYTWRDSDWEEIQSSDCLFARKFNVDVDKEIVGKVCEIVKNERTFQNSSI